MNKYILLIITALTVTLYSCQTDKTTPIQPKKTDLEALELKGRVKDVVVFLKILNADESLTKERKHSSLHFTDFGMAAEQKFYDFIGQPVKTLVYEYNQMNQLIRTEYRDVEQLVSIDELYSYDEQGRLQKKEKQSNGLTTGISVELYDTTGNIIETFRKNGDQLMLEQVHTYTYDSLGKERSINSVFLADKDTLLARKNFTYYPNNKLRQEASESDMGKTTIDYTYSDNALIEIIVTRNDVVSNNTKFDTLGNAIWEIVYDESGSLISETSSTYSFDNKGNWTEKTVSEHRPGENDQMEEIKIYKRVFTYY